MNLLSVKVCLLYTYRNTTTSHAMWSTAKRLRTQIEKLSEEMLIVDTVLRAANPRLVVELALLNKEDSA